MWGRTTSPQKRQLLMVAWSLYTFSIGGRKGGTDQRVKTTTEAIWGVGKIVGGRETVKRAGCVARWEIFRREVDGVFGANTGGGMSGHFSIVWCSVTIFYFHTICFYLPDKELAQEAMTWLVQGVTDRNCLFSSRPERAQKYFYCPLLKYDPTNMPFLRSTFCIDSMKSNPLKWSFLMIKVYKSAPLHGSV